MLRLSNLSYVNLVLAFIITASLSLIFFFPSSDSSVIYAAQQFCNDPNSGSQSASDGGRKALKFTTPPSGLEINDVILDIWRGTTGSPGTVSVGIYNHDSFNDEPQGSALVEVSRSQISYSSSPNNYTCSPDTFGDAVDTFNMGGFSLLGDTSYWVQLSADNTQAQFWNGQFGAPQTDRLCSAAETGGWTCFETWGVNYEINGINPAIPTPTPTSTPTPEPGERWDVARFTCDRPDLGIFGSCAGDDAGSIPVVASELNGYDIIQPFKMEATATADKIWLDLTKTGNPTAGLFGFITELNGASKTVDSNEDLLASFVLPPDAWEDSAVLTNEVDLSSTISLVPEQDYGIWLIGSCGPSDCDTAVDRYYWSYATATDSFDEPDWPWSMDYNAYRFQNDGTDPSNWVTYPENPDWVIHAFRILGFPEGVSTGTPTPTPPSDPPESEPDPFVTQYDYTPDNLNKIKGFSPLSYDFTSLEDDTSFSVRMLDDNGDPTQTLTSVIVQPSTAGIGSFSISTISFPEGPIDVYDVTNGQRLVKHFVMEGSSFRAFEDRPHRCSSACYIALEPIAKLDTLTGHLYDETNPSHFEKTVVEHGDFFRLYFQYPDASDTDDAAIRIRNLDTFETIVDVDLTTVYVNQMRLGTSSYDESQLVFNTTGDVLPFIQVRELQDVLDTPFPPGVYNYALVDTNTNAILSEGESLLIVRPSDAKQTISMEAPVSAELGADFTATVRFGAPVICRQYLDWTWSYIEPNVTYGDTPSVCGTRHTITHKMPNSTVLTLPKTSDLQLTAAPFFVPFATDPLVYSVTLTDEMEFIAECDISCQLGRTIPDTSDSNKGLFSFLILGGVLLLGVVKGIPMLATGFLLAIATGALFTAGWISEGAMLSMGIIVVAVFVFLALRSRIGSGADA